MPINTSREDLPAAERPGGNPPDPEARFVTAIAQAWWLKRQADEQRPMSVGGRRFRASWASLRCDRALAYQVATVDESDPPGMASHWRMFLGQLGHTALDDTIQALYPTAQVEVAVDLRPAVDGAASLDVVITEPLEDAVKRLTAAGRSVPAERVEAGRPWITNIELKTVGGYKFKLAATRFKGPPEGPDWSAVVQGALAGAALGSDEMVVANLSLELVGEDIARSYGLSDEGRFAAEWTYDWHEIQGIAKEEHRRINWVVSQVQVAEDTLGPFPAGDHHAQQLALRAKIAERVPRRLSDPEYPKGARVTDPVTQTWMVIRRGVDEHGNPVEQVTNVAKTWMCNYCRWQHACIEDGDDHA